VASNGCRMNNSIRLFDQGNVEHGLPKPERIATAVTNILVANAELEGAVKELSKRFDAMEIAIASIDDAEARSRYKQSSKLSRETLLSAMRRLTQVIGELAACRAR
jgi:histidinol dehydrogenase